MALEDVIGELRPLAGGRIQRVDVVADRELVLELRHPGRTVRLLVCYRPGASRVHVVEARPKRLTEGGELQRALRRRLEGQALVGIGVEGHNVLIDVERARLEVRLKEHALAFLPPSGQSAPPMPDPGALPEQFPLSAAIAQKFETKGEDDARRSLAAQLTRQIDARKKKLEKLRFNLDRDLERLEAMAASRRLGELLKTSLHAIGRGQREVRVCDYETQTEVVIPLDPAFGPKANMERLFARAKKAERGRPVVQKRRAALEEELEALAEVRSSIEAAGLDALIDLAARIGYGTSPRDVRGISTSAESKAEGAATGKKKPIDEVSRRFVAVDGTEIRVGKGAKENDRLSLAFARGDDIWLHASGTPGAHVLLRMEKNRPLNREALLDAALLAAHYSGAKAHAAVDVTYTEARHVRKIKGDPPGRVSVAKAKTVRVVIDPARLDRLFGRGSA